MENKANILIIEDDVLLNDMTKRLLTQHGYCVISAYSGSEALLLILIMGASRYDIDYSFSAIGAFLLLQCLCFLGYTAFLNLLSYLLRHRIIVTITAFFLLGVLYLYLTKISTALDMDYSLYKYWVVGLSHSLQVNTIGEDLIPILVTLGIYLFLPTAISFSLFQRLDLRGLERR